MSKELNIILERVNNITKKEDRTFTMSITSYINSNNIAVNMEDTIESLANKFDVSLKDNYKATISSYLVTNNFLDKIDFMCYILYIIKCFMLGKKIPVNLPIKIGEINSFKNSLIKEIILSV